FSGDAEARVKRWGKSPPASWRHGGSPNPVRCKANRSRQQAARRGTGLLPRQMATHDRIRLTGLLPGSPAPRGFRIFSRRPRPCAGKCGGPCGDEGCVLADHAVQVRVRSHDHVIADACRMAIPAANERVLHDDRLPTDLNRPRVGGDHRVEQNATVVSDRHVAADHRRRRDVCADGDAGTPSVALDHHVRSFPLTRAIRGCMIAARGLIALGALVVAGSATAAPPPAAAPLPRQPAELARALVATTASLRASIDSWRGQGDNRPPADVTLYALYEQRL